MSIDFYGKAKSKRKRGRPQGKFAAWFSSRASFGFTTPLSLDECAERLNQKQLIESCNTADIPFGYRSDSVYSLTFTRNTSGDDLEFSILERKATGKYNSLKNPPIRSKIEGYIHQIDSQFAFVEGQITFNFSRYLALPVAFPVFLLLFSVFNSNMQHIIANGAFCLGLMWLGSSSWTIYLGLIENHHVKTTRLALICDMLEAKQKFDQTEENEATDGNSPGSTYPIEIP